MRQPIDAFRVWNSLSSRLLFSKSRLHFIRSLQLATVVLRGLSIQSWHALCFTMTLGVYCSAHKPARPGYTPPSGIEHEVSAVQSRWVDIEWWDVHRSYCWRLLQLYCRMAAPARAPGSLSRPVHRSLNPVRHLLHSNTFDFACSIQTIAGQIPRRGNALT